MIHKNQFETDLKEKGEPAEIEFAYLLGCDIDIISNYGSLQLENGYIKGTTDLDSSLKEYTCLFISSEILLFTKVLQDKTIKKNEMSKHLQQKGIVSNINTDYKYDILVENSPVQPELNFLVGKYIEVKNDLGATQYKNVFIEYISRGKTSGISTTEAEYYAIWISKKQVILISTDKLKDLCRPYHGTYRDVKGGDDKTSKGIKLPIYDIFNVSTETNEIQIDDRNKLIIDRTIAGRKKDWSDTFLFKVLILRLLEYGNGFTEKEIEYFFEKIAIN